jgi:hypothetical protein
VLSVSASSLRVHKPVERALVKAGCKSSDFQGGPIPSPKSNLLFLARRHSIDIRPTTQSSSRKLLCLRKWCCCVIVGAVHENTRNQETVAMGEKVDRWISKSTVARTVRSTWNVL